MHHADLIPPPNKGGGGSGTQLHLSSIPHTRENWLPWNSRGDSLNSIFEALGKMVV